MPKDKTAKGDEEPEPVDPVAAGVAQIRSTAKWLVAGFGALGAGLIASIQLSDVGDLSGHALRVALSGFAIGIFGVLVALLAAAFVLAAVRVSVHDLDKSRHLRHYLDANTELFAGYEDLHSVMDEY